MTDTSPTIKPHPETDSMTQADMLKAIGEAEADLKLAKEIEDEQIISWKTQEIRMLQSALNARNGKSTNGTKFDGPLIELIETIAPEDVDFLWKGRIPRGKLTSFFGDPGIGKSTAASMIAATISRGAALPFDKEPEAPLKTLIISAEDSPADVLRPRLEKMQADLSMIAIPNRQITTTPSAVDVTLVDHMLEEFPAALCIIDPVIAYTKGKNTNNASEVREFLGPLTSIAEKYKTAIIMIGHMTKAAGTQAIYRSQGSIDFIAASRSAFVFGKDNDNQDRRLMSHAKSSLSKLHPTIEFFIDDDGIFRWGAENNQTADEVVAPGRKPERRNEAQQFLAKILENGPMPSNEIIEKAKTLGIAKRTIWRAKTQLDIKASEDRETGAWFWRLL